MEKSTDEIIREKLGPIVVEMKMKMFQSGYHATDAEALGIIVSKYLEYDINAVAECAKSAFEDSNCPVAVGIMETFINESEI